MKQLLVLLILMFSFVCQGQTKMEDIDYKDIVEIKGLLYLKADTTLVSGKVIRYNKKNEAKKYILVSKGKPDESGWMDINNIEYLRAYNNILFGSNLYGRERQNMNYVNDRISVERDNLVSDRVELNELKSNQDSNKHLDIQGNYYLNGKKDGLWEKYYSNGQLNSKVKYIKGKKNGLWEEYYYNGQLESKVNYINGKKDGLWEEYHENGQLWSQGKYIVGRKTGKWEYFDYKGELLGTEIFD